MKLPNLERYNQVVWAVVGTGIVVIAAVTVLTATGALLYSMFKGGSRGVPVAVVDENVQDDPRRDTPKYDFCQPIVVPGSPYQLIRIASDRLVVRNKQARLSKMGSGYSSDEESRYETCGLYGSDRPSAVVNVLVRQRQTGIMHLVLNENAVILALEYAKPRSRGDEDESDSAFPPRGVLYWEIASDDSNGDGVIDDYDDAGAYLSEADGSGLVRITPKPSRVLEKTYDKRRNVLLLRIITDTNSDGKLDEADTPSLIETSVAERKVAREVLDKKTLAEFMRDAEPRRIKKSSPH
jgi:hypothetical protein